MNAPAPQTISLTSGTIGLGPGAASSSATWATSSPLATNHSSVTLVPAWCSVSPPASVLSVADGFSSGVVVSVVPLSLSKLEIEQPTPSAAKGTTLQLTVKGTYNDGTTKDLTASSSWTSSSTTIVKMDPVTKGLAGAQSVGTSNITATFGIGANAVTSDPVVFTVTPATLSKLDITMLTASIEKGGTFQFHATGKFSDNSTQDMTNQVIWSSSETTVRVIEGGY